MGKLNASVGENIWFRFRRGENASALSGVFVSFPFSINQLVVESFIEILFTDTSKTARSGRHLLTRAH